MADLVIKGAWKKGVSKYEQDAIELWYRLKVMPPDQTAEARAKELTAVAYADDRLVGITTASIDVLPKLRAKFAMNRVLVDPEFQSQGALGPLMQQAFRDVESWAVANPDVGLAGLAGIREQISSDPVLNRPFNATSGTTLIGYTDAGQQIRVRWFPHYRPDAQAGAGARHRAGNA